MVSVSRVYFLFFCALVVYGAAALLLLRRAVRYVQRRHAGEAATPSAPKSSLLWFERATYGLAVLGTLMLAYAFVEPYWPQIEHVVIPAPGLAAGRPIRIVQLSDLHCDPKPRTEERLPALVAELAPDLIVFTGDAINSEGGLPVFNECMRELARVAPVYAVRGNWEVWWFDHVDLYDGTGVRLLRNERERVEVDGREIWLAGVSVDSEAVIGTVLDGVPEDRFCLFLHHFPSAGPTASRSGADLTLCGDTHGGQTWLPILGELVRIRRDGVWLPRGLHKEGDMYLYVNRGIGMEGGAVPRVRFMTRPEITLIELMPQDDPSRIQ